MDHDESGPSRDDRRRLDRRGDFVSLADYTVPELRKALVTFALLALIIGLFIYMVNEVVVAVIAGIVVGVYLIPLQRWLAHSTGRPNASAISTIILFTVPLVLVLAYSWIEISGAANYLVPRSWPASTKACADCRTSSTWSCRRTSRAGSR
jgi:uncharacterized membrane protein (UPF0136 family)